MSRHPAKELPDLVLRALCYEPEHAIRICRSNLADWRYWYSVLCPDWPADTLLRFVNSTAIARDASDARLMLEEATNGAYTVVCRTERHGRKTRSFYRIAKTTPALADELTTRRARNTVQTGQGVLLADPKPSALQVWP